MALKVLISPFSLLTLCFKERKMRKRTLIVTGLVSIIGLSACDREKEIQYVEVEKVKPLACEKQEDYSIPDKHVVQMKDVRLKRTRQYTRRYDCKGKIISDKLETFTEKKQDIELYSLRQVKGHNPKRIAEELNSIQGTAFNRQTCSSAKRDPFSLFNQGVVSLARIFIETLTLQQRNEVLERRPSIVFTIDTAPALLTTEVNRGVQMVDYKFIRTCGKRAKDRSDVEKFGYHRPDRNAGNMERDAHRRQKPIKDDRVCNQIFEEGTMVLAVSYDDVEVPGVREIWPSKCN